MGSNYSATEEQWAALEREAHYTAFNCILELRARIEALEAAQQPDQIAPEPEWQQLSEREPQDGDRCAYRVAPRFTKELGTWSSVVRRFWASDKGLFYGDPECISWRLAMPHELFPQQPAPATEESSATAPPAPAVGLVETVGSQIPLLPDGRIDDAIARTVIYVIAAWLRSETWLGRAAADRLEQEASR